jgi:hypothetical protein
VGCIAAVFSQTPDSKADEELKKFSKNNNHKRKPKSKPDVRTDNIENMADQSKTFHFP